MISTAPAAAQPKTELIGFYVNWDPASFTSLRQNHARIDKLIPEWLYLARADGTVALNNPTQQTQVLTYLRAHQPDLLITPLINNFNSERMEWDAAKIGAMLTNRAARTRTIQQLLRFVRDHGFMGVSIDFENIPDSAQGALKTFMHELYTLFHAFGLEVSQSVPLNDPKIDYLGLAQWNDYFILMGYDEHWSSGKAGPIASQRWFTAGLQKRFAELPPQKYVIGIGNYGYDWTMGKERAKELSFQDALHIAQNSRRAIRFDPQALNPTFDYYDNTGTLHYVWFLNAVTAFNQLVEGQRYSPRGFGLWRLGTEDPSIWAIFDQRAQLDRATAQTLHVLHTDGGPAYEGEGEVLQVTAIPTLGARALTYDEQSGLITAEYIRKYASPYVITRWGRNRKQKIALTFDDGPDQRYTPQVLDVLRRYHVPATFFIIGLNGMFNTELLQRIVDDGHEIGNHTFTHLRPSMMSPQRLIMEVNATQRLFESRLGLRSVLFRPPYGEGIQPTTNAQVKSLLLISQLGYYTVGMQIEPQDWQKPGVDQIVNTTINSVVHGDGNIVLLHDGGGDRSQTVAALPQIIERLRAHGFELVTVSSLLGLTRAAVMPPLPRDEHLGSHIMEVGFRLISWGHTTIASLFVTGILLCVLRLLIVGTFAVKAWRKSRHAPPASPEFLPSISVIIPAYNEEKVICQTIGTLLLSDYTNFTIIVVDDGSTDETVRRVRESFGQEPRVHLYSKGNGGKAQALNYGLQQTQDEVIVLLDADTIFRRDTISKLVGHFVNQQVGAVAGNVKVGNRINLLTKWQALEYITSQNIDRRASNALNCISVVPGALGAWRRELVLQTGGFTDETLAEDADLTLTLLRMGYSISYEDEAIAWTEAPDTVRGFVKQRFRWTYGTLQAAWKHLDTLCRPRYGALGIFALPNILIFQIMFPLLLPVMDLYAMWTLIAMAWHRYHDPLHGSTESFQLIVFSYACFLIIDFFVAVVAFFLERKEDWSLLAWLLLQRFLYRQLMCYVALKSTLNAMRGTIVGWGKLERKATVVAFLDNRRNFLR